MLHCYDFVPNGIELIYIIIFKGFEYYVYDVIQSQFVYPFTYIIILHVFETQHFIVCVYPS
jgi:hypothetical protein